MNKYFQAANGVGYSAGTMDGKFLNAHLSYKGRSVIVDYERYLHCYGHIDDNVVPFEVYPYGGDIYLGYAHINDKFGKVDIAELMKLIDEALENEPEPFDWEETDEE